MRLSRFLSAIGCLALVWSHAAAADPVAMPGGVVVAQAVPKTPQTPAAPALTPPEVTQPPSTSPFGESSPAGTEQAASATPQMLGDSLSYTMGGSRAISSSSSIISSGGVSGSASSAAIAPVRSLGGSSFKTSDNDSPRPVDRAFLAVDYFTRVLHSIRDQAFGGPAPSLRLARQMFGFEKTFIDGNASFEMRVPFFQVHDTGGLSLSDIGDVTLLTKFAFVNEHDQDADRVFTVGVALTAPTGPNDVVAGTTINPTILQPYVGYLFGNRDWFVQGFSEVAISLSDTVPTVWFNDVGVDYYAYRGSGCSFIQALVPTVEAHLTTPFGKQGSGATPVGVLDTLVLTGGFHVVFKNALLTLGYEFPVTGPQPFESEYVVQFNYLY
jgi:hypothetical protein